MKQTAFGLLLGFFLLSACENDPSDVAALLATLNPEVEQATEVEILYSDSSLIKVRIQGPTMLTYLDRNDQRQEFPDGVRVEFFSPEGDITSVLTAKYGVRIDSKNQIIVRDSVVWQSVEQEKLETEELIWDERAEKVFTQKFVVITRPDEIITGHGFESDQNFENARINAVDGRIKISDPSKLKD
ncbi:MAG: LPS export ABC transporter periplasmic protein LptC [Saprospiraceae bacterium]|nr:LPS export ABC transporter periplasmic protein LptC [Lewinella sp.]